MTDLLDHAVHAARRLSPEIQDEIAQIILGLAGAGDDGPIVPLTGSERAAIAASKAAASRGEFASEDDVQAVWSKYGL